VRFEIVVSLYVKIIFWDMVPCMTSLIDVHELLEEYTASIFMVEEQEEKSAMKVEGVHSSYMPMNIHQLI
jgi:hypothetical protein